MSRHDSLSTVKSYLQSRTIGAALGVEIEPMLLDTIADLLLG